MADFARIIPRLLRWEVGLKPSEEKLPPRAMYEAVAPRGYHVVKGDKGGPTMCGVTLATYADYCRSHGMPQPTTDDLRRLPYAQWYDIAKSVFWARYKGDRIVNQSVAEMLIDWAWHAGGNAIRAAQRALGTDADGVVGSLTLSRLNGNPAAAFARLKAARLAYYNKVGRGSNARFLQGWLNRCNDIRYED